LDESLVEDLRNRHRDDVEHEPAGEGGDRKRCEHRHCNIEDERHFRGVRALRDFIPALVCRSEIGNADRHADDRRQGERRSPAERSGDGRCQPGCKRHAKIAVHPVACEIATAVAGVRDQDRNSDRMIDRCEDAEHEQRDRKHDRVGRGRGNCERAAAAEKEDRHQLAAAPMVPCPTPGQREQAERNEARRRKRYQFAVGAAQFGLESDHDGREDQDHVMIDEVCGVDEADLALGSIHWTATPEARDYTRRRAAPLIDARRAFRNRAIPGSAR